MIIEGQCHCGNLRYTFETSHDLAPRECQCGFCRRHGARCASDPDGRVRIAIHDQDLLIRYRFDLRTADFLVCGCCGNYLGALLQDGDQLWSTVNLRLGPAADHPAEPASYEGEDTAQRVARRKDRWTPTALSAGN